MGITKPPEPTVIEISRESFDEIMAALRPEQRFVNEDLLNKSVLNLVVWTGAYYGDERVILSTKDSP